MHIIYISIEESTPKKTSEYLRQKPHCQILEKMQSINGYLGQVAIMGEKEQTYGIFDSSISI